MANKIAKSFNFGGEDTYILSVDWDAIDGKPEVVNGQDGKDGADGVSPTVSVSTITGGHRLTITDKNGTKTVDIMDGADGADGADGEDGQDGQNGKDGQAGQAGADGERGHSILKVTTAPTSYTTATGGKNPIKRMALSTIKTQAKVDEVIVGDQILYSYYLYNIYYLDASYAYMDAYTSIRGATGAAGSKGADGYTPIKGTDYYTDADKAEMVEAVKDSMEGIPDYWQTALDEGAEAINTALCTAGCNKSAFLFYSDAHWNYGSQMSPALLKYLYKHTGMTKTFFGGDIVNDEASDYDTMEYLWNWRNQLKDLPNHHSVVGNHDDGNSTNNLFSEQYVYGYLLAAEETSDVVRGGVTWYYIDNGAEKTRYIFLDTAYKGMTSEQTAFLKEALLGTAEGWHIVVVAHIWYLPDYDQYDVRPIPIAGMDTNASAVATILDAYNARSGDYANSGAKVEFCVGGHVHRDYVGATTGGIPIILVETDSMHLRSDLTYTAGTTTEASVNGIIADYGAKKVNVVRIGRGASFIVDLTTGGTEDPDTPTEPTYTNLLDEVGYKKGVYLSNGNESTDANAYTTGYIPCVAGDIIRLKNITLPNESSHGNRISCYNSSKTFISGTTYNITSDKTDLHPVFEDGNLVQFTAPSHSGTAYIRLSAWLIDDTSIITVNEPIE